MSLFFSLCGFFFFFLPRNATHSCAKSAGAQTGDAIFTFGGLDEKGYWDSLYALGNLPTSGGIPAWKLLRTNKTVNSVGRYGVKQSMSVNNFPSARAGSCMDFIT